MNRALTFVIAFQLVLLTESELCAQVKKTYEYATQGGRYTAVDKKQQRFRTEYVIDGQYRQPVSILSLGDQRALVATKLSGEIYEFDLVDLSLKVVFKDTSRQFRKMISMGDDRIAIADCAGDEVVICQWESNGEGWKQAAVLKIPGSPNGLFYDDEQQQLWATSTWGQQLFRYRVQSHGAIAPKLIDVTDLPMCGGQVLCIPEHHVVLVTDAFGCDFVAVNQDSGKIINHDRLYEHNICELMAMDDGNSVLFPQQLLNELSAALQTDITWGNFLSNNLRWLKTERLLTSSGEQIYDQSRFVPIGSVGNGAGDPTSMSVAGDGTIAITIGGTGQVAIGSLQGRGFQLIDVGMHPVDCVFINEGGKLLVVNQFSDSVTQVDIATFDVRHVSLGPIRPPTDEEQGEQLFHDSTLSHDGWMSCQSCHSGGHTNGLLTDNFTDESYRSPKRVLSLLGQAETAPYSWSGAMKSLEEQISFSISSTMASDNPVEMDDVRKIAAYVRTLPRPPSIQQARSGSNEPVQKTKQIHRGQRVFNSIGCVECHRKPYFTSEGTYDVGLSDERAMREFNPPSLIGISQRQNSLLHDGRAKSIRDVIDKERHQLPDNITARQRNDLIEFLRSL